MTSVSDKVHNWLGVAPLNFHWIDEPPYHTTRRVAIRKKHPDVDKLEGVEPLTKWLVTAVVIQQFIVAYFMREQPWWVILLTAYCWGGTWNHSLFLVIHEISHNLLFEIPILNTVFLFVANLPIPVPMSMSFQKYHRLHHIYLNTFEMDPDLPTQFEGRFFVGPIRKLIWLILQPLTYTIRPLFQQPIPLTRAELIQWAVQFSVDALVVYFWGWTPLVYLFLATLLGGSLHPMSGHYIAEHYEWAKGYETYSYYGPLNWLGWNVGFHNEHHDFPRVPFTKLPALKKLAPEYYDNLPFHSSWVALMVRFIVDPELNPFARRVRIPKGKESIAAEMTAAARNRDDEGEE
eukprot:TRINITY_DN322_c0_g1_i2.p1 TRINITY_DN322_c0_g1~~TRINITY_DN322_c0_g1_i2.p1  ORF type:complete len:347 (-),score=47.46 TRINITY_DN322_c0_g1_i2:502-1542(-)